MATEMRLISFTGLRRQGAPALRFVTEEAGHLWLTFHGKPTCAVIPMAHERVLHRAIGINPTEAMHRALVAADRMVGAITEHRMQQVMPAGSDYPNVGLDDATYRAWKVEHRLIDPIKGVTGGAG